MEAPPKQSEPSQPHYRDALKYADPTFKTIDSPNLSTTNSDNSFEVNLCPNPNNGTFQIEANFALSDISNMKVVNLLGVSIYETQRLASHTVQLPTAASGQFFVIIVLKDGTVISKKMMVQR
jgi:hypothetical protein